MKKSNCKNNNMNGSCRVFPSRDSSLRELRGSPSKRVTHSWFALLTLLLSFVVFNSVSALTYQNDTNIDFTINPTISVSLSGDLIINDLVPGSYSDSNIITVNVATNASHGYYLAATVGTSSTNANLNHSSNSSYKFTNLTTNKTTLSGFDDNQWGYSYSTDNGANWVSGSQGATSAGYNGLPLDGNDSGDIDIILIDTASPVANNSVKFKIGAKASNTQPSGTYTNTINFYAVTHQAPLYMQYVSSSTLATLMPNVNDSTILYDIRDNQEYTVTKLADGKYWMTKNLNIAGGTALSSVDTDVDRVYIDNFTTSNNLTKTNNTIVLPESSTTGFNTNNYSYVYNTGNNTDNCADPGCYSYYSWDAATLGSGRSISTDNTDAPYSICPKGWRLPNTRFGTDNSSDYRALAIAYGGSSSIQIYNSETSPTGSAIYDALTHNTPPGFLNAGVYRSTFQAGGSGGYYWASTSNGNGNGARSISIWSTAVNIAFANVRNDGFSIRCLARE